MIEGRAPADVGRLFAGFTAYAEPFRSLVTELGGVAPPGEAPATATTAREAHDG
jgi:hypothetical protein